MHRFGVAGEAAKPKVPFERQLRNHHVEWIARALSLSQSAWPASNLIQRKVAGEMKAIVGGSNGCKDLRAVNHSFKEPLS
jgi:hypothetical protein